MVELTQRSGPADGAVGAELDDAAVHHSVLGQEEFVVSVDGVDQVSANRLSVAHGNVVVDAEGERSFGGQSAAFGLAEDRAGKDGEGDDQGRFTDHFRQFYGAQP